MPDFKNRLLSRVSAPAGEPVSLEDAKLFLRVTHDDEDTLIYDLIVAARMIAEEHLKRSLMTQSWKLAYDDYLPACVILPMGPVNSVTSVTLFKRDGSSQAMAASGYYLTAGNDRLFFDSPPYSHRIEVVYAAGFGNANAVPRAIKQGMLAHIAAMYDDRGESGSSVLPQQTMALYMPFRGTAL